MLLPSLVFAESSWISLSFTPLSLHWLIFLELPWQGYIYLSSLARTTGEFLNCMKCPGTRSSWRSSLRTNPGVYLRLQKVTRNSQWPQGDFSFPFRLHLGFQGALLLPCLIGAVEPWRFGDFGDFSTDMESFEVFSPNFSWFKLLCCLTWLWASLQPGRSCCESFQKCYSAWNSFQGWDDNGSYSLYNFHMYGGLLF